MIAALITLSIVAYLIGRYYKAVKQTQYDNLSKARDYWQEQHRVALKARNDAYEIVENLKGLIEDKDTKLAERERIASKALADFANAPKFQVVNNTQKHPAANDKYLYLEGELQGTREAGLLRLSQWNEAKETLRKNPEDKPQ